MIICQRNGGIFGMLMLVPTVHENYGKNRIFERRSRMLVRE